ncbi:MAG TPA: DUF1289 domain-containing protein [Stellaceae bacterium]
MSESHPASPCTAVCVLDPASGFCRGCYRTIDEIAGWASLGAAEKRKILDRLPARRARAGAAQPPPNTLSQ